MMFLGKVLLLETANFATNIRKINQSTILLENTYFFNFFKKQKTLTKNTTKHLKIIIAVPLWEAA